MSSEEQGALPNEPVLDGRNDDRQSSADSDGPVESDTLRDAPASWSDRPAVTARPAVHPAKQIGQRPRFSNFWALMGCNAVVFVGSVCIMVLELTASRMIAKHVGNSLYTWTSVIGVVLAGITFGNFIGGWLADRFVNRQRTLSWLFLLASAISASVLIMDRLVADFDRGNLEWPVWVLYIVAVIFLLPAVALGTISPVAASIALSRSVKTGITVGNVYAWGALGSIAGTFLTGFWLIDLSGTRAIVGMTAGTLAVMGVLVASGQWVFRTAVVLGWLQFLTVTGLAATADAGSARSVGKSVGSLLAGASSLWSDEKDREKKIADWSQFVGNVGSNLHQLGLTLGLRDDQIGEYHDESNYSYIYVGDSFEDGDAVKYLLLDKLPHSYYNPQNPTALYYDYEKIYAAVTERAAFEWNQTTSVLFGQTPLPEDIRANLPSWIEYDADEKRLSIQGTLISERRAELLAASPVAPYWLALEQLRDLTNAADFGGVQTATLDELPQGVEIPEPWRQTVRYDWSFRTLSAFGVVTDELFEQLVVAAPHAGFYRAVGRLFEQSSQVSTMFIGGGGFIFPRWIEEKFPYHPRIHVAELDPAVKLAVQIEMGLPPDDQTAVKTFIGDARNTVDDRLRLNGRLRGQNKPPVLYDFIYGDAFNDFSVPWHLTTQEFSEKIKQLLHPQRGVYLVNIIDIYPRTEYPNADEYKAETRFRGDVPEQLSPDWQAGYEYEWHPCPRPWESLELRQHEDGNEIIFGYRGRMSDEMRHQLVSLAPKNKLFADALRKLGRRSRIKREGRFLGRYVNSIAQVFENVYVFSSDSGHQPSNRRDTFVIVVSLQQLDLNDLKYKQYTSQWYGEPFAWIETDPQTDKQKRGGQIDSVLALADGQKLTDDYAPVDNLLIPVFVDQGN